MHCRGDEYIGQCADGDPLVDIGDEIESAEYRKMVTTSLCAITRVDRCDGCEENSHLWSQLGIGSNSFNADGSVNLKGTISSLLGRSVSEENPLLTKEILSESISSAKLKELCCYKDILILERHIPAVMFFVAVMNHLEPDELSSKLDQCPEYGNRNIETCITATSLLQEQLGVPGKLGEVAERDILLYPTRFYQSSMLIIGYSSCLFQLSLHVDNFIALRCGEIAQDIPIRIPDRQLSDFEYHKQLEATLQANGCNSPVSKHGLSAKFLGCLFETVRSVLAEKRWEGTYVEFSPKIPSGSVLFDCSPQLFQLLKETEHEEAISRAIQMSILAECQRKVHAKLSREIPEVVDEPEHHMLLMILCIFSFPLLR